jgi:hypothetical protein
MNLFVLFFLIEIGLIIIVSIKIVKKYNNMLDEKFNYLKTKITCLENQFNELSKLDKVIKYNTTHEKKRKEKQKKRETEKQRNNRNE